MQANTGLDTVEYLNNYNIILFFLFFLNVSFLYSTIKYSTIDLFHISKAKIFISFLYILEIIVNTSKIRNCEHENDLLII